MTIEPMSGRLKKKPATVQMNKLRNEEIIIEYFIL